MAKKRIIGVDFGTSTSVIRVKSYEEGKSQPQNLDTKEVIFGGMGAMVPTLIQKKNDNESVVYYGFEAEQKKKKTTTYHSFKVDLESSDSDKKALARKLTEEFFGFLAEKYKEQSKDGHLGESDEQEQTIVSYPVKWSEETRAFMLEAAKKAGFPNVSGMDEAQAAIHAVTVQSNDYLREKGLLVKGVPTNILLIDMGAGTTDLVLCRYTAGDKAEIEILNTWPKDGDILFGGKEVDSLLQDFFRKMMDPMDAEQAFGRIGIDSFKSWKEKTVSPALEKNDAVTEFFALDNYAELVGIEMDDYKLNRASFEQCAKDYLVQLPLLVTGCLKDANMNGGNVDLVIVTGGHSQWYFVKEMLKGKMKQFGEMGLTKIEKEPFRLIPISRPQETVALGLVYSPIPVKVTIPKKENDDRGRVKAPDIYTSRKVTIDKCVDVECKYQKEVKGGIGQYAHCKVQFEPLDLKRGKNYEFVNTVVGNSIPKEYIPAIDLGIQDAMKETATHGVELIGIKANCYDGSYHEVESSESAFHNVGSMALKEALKKATLVPVVQEEKKKPIAPSAFRGDDTKLLNRVSMCTMNSIDLIKPNNRVWNSKGYTGKKSWMNLKSIIHEGPFSVGLQNDGVVVAEEHDLYGRHNVWGWKNIKSIILGGTQLVGLREDGTVVAIGKNDDGQCNVERWKNIKSIACGGWHTVGLREDGTVVATGANKFGQCNVERWRNIKSIVCGCHHTVGLREDGTVVAIGNNDDGRCDVGGWKNVKSILCGEWSTIGLREDGTVVATGHNKFGQCNVGEWKNIKSIACGGGHIVGLKEDGTVVAKGCNCEGQCNVSQWKDIIAIKVDGDNTIGIQRDGRVIYTAYDLHKKEKRNWYGKVIDTYYETEILPSKITSETVF